MQIQCLFTPAADTPPPPYQTQNPHSPQNSMTETNSVPQQQPMPQQQPTSNQQQQQDNTSMDIGPHNNVTVSSHPGRNIRGELYRVMNAN